ncbi:Amiloride-sensitive cation channel 3, partial [Ophiophagus hannah]
MDFIALHSTPWAQPGVYTARSCSPSLRQDRCHLTPGLTPDPPGAAESSDGVSLQQSKPKAMDAWEGEAAPDLVAFAKRCTLHGVGHVFLPGPLTPHRTAWAAAILVALGLVLYQVSERLQCYVGYEHVTTLGKSAGRRLTFPAVSFCNLNRIRRSQLSPYDLPWVGRALLGVEPSDYLAYGRALGWPEPAAGQAFPGGSFNLREFVERTSHKLEDMLLACRFGNRPCGTRDFRPVNETSYEAGIKVQIHSQSEPPTVDQLGFGVAPGFQTLVACQEQRVGRGGTPGQQRGAPFFIVLPISPLGPTGSRADPAHPGLPSFPAALLPASPLGRLPGRPCRIGILPQLQRRRLPDRVRDALPGGELRLPDGAYAGKQLSVVKIPSKASAKYLAKKYNRSEQYIAENLLVLDIFFEALNYETIEQKKAYEVAGLLGEGHWGPNGLVYWRQPADHPGDFRLPV